MTVQSAISRVRHAVVNGNGNGVSSEFGGSTMAMNQFPTLVETYPFLQYTCCSMCHKPFVPGSTTSFWITSCAHVLCDGHEHQSGVCTHCRRHDIQAVPIQPGRTNPAFFSRFLNASRHTNTMAAALEAVEFQNKQLMGLVRHYKQKIQELQQNEADMAALMAELKTMEEQTKTQNQDLVRQLNELRVQNQSLSTQNQTQSNRIHDLSTKLLAFGSGTPVSIPRQMGSSTMMAPMVPAPAGSMGPPPLPAKRGFLSVYDLYKQEGSERGAVFGEAPHPRRSRDMALMGVKGATFEQPDHYPTRPNTALPLPSRIDNIGRPHSVNSLNTLGQGGPRHNFEEYRHRIPSGANGPLSLQPVPNAKPSFTLARPSNSNGAYGSTTTRRSFVPPTGEFGAPNVNIEMDEGM